MADICRRVDGLPLAIELAAAQIKHFSGSELLPRLGRRLDTLTDGPRDLPDRLQTMRNAIAWSYDLLSAEEQVFLRRLAVFAGDFDVDAARAIHRAHLTRDDPGSGAQEQDRTRRLLMALVDKSLVRHDRVAHQDGRYRLLETIREFAFDQLVAHDEADQLAAVHAAYYLGVVEELAESNHGAAEIAAFARLDAERDNIRAAFTWAAGDQGDVSLGLRLGGAIWWYWYVRGDLQEGWQWLQALLGRETSAVAPAVVADGGFAAGALALRMLLPDDAERLLREALEHYEALGHQAGAAFARCALAYNAIFGAGDTERAFPLLREALAGAMAIGDRWVEAATCNGLTLSYLVLGDLDAARMWGERTLALSRTDGDIQGSATAHGLLGLTARRRGDATAALGHFREALANYERIGDGFDRQRAILRRAATRIDREVVGRCVALHEREPDRRQTAHPVASLHLAGFEHGWRTRDPDEQGWHARQRRTVVDQRRVVEDHVVENHMVSTSRQGRRRVAQD